MLFHQFFDPSLAQFSYLIACEQTKKAIIIDPLRHVEPLLNFAHNKGYELVAVTETHIHADYLSGSITLCRQHGITTYLSAYGGAHWSYRWPNDQDPVHLLKENDSIRIGSTLTLTAMHTPGHTPEHIVFKVHDHHRQPIGLITGDCVFADDLGRPDLLEKAAKEHGQMQLGAEALFASVQKLKKLPKELILWPGHGAGSSCGKSLGARPYTSWGYEQNVSPILAYHDQRAFCQAILSQQTEPPLYFARMKTANRDGHPHTPFTPCEKIKDISKVLASWSQTSTPGVVLDTVRNKHNFMKKPWPYSLLAPQSMVLTAVGSLIKEANTPIVIAAHSEQDAHRIHAQLYNIGFDQVLGYTTHDALDALTNHRREIPVIGFDTLSKQTKGKKAWIVDVRTLPEYEKDGFQGATHAPMQRLNEYLPDLPSDAPLYVHCQAGGRAAMCTSYLHGLGYQVVLVDGAKPKTL